MSAVRVTARAKLNLTLEIGEKRPDGFHDLHSLAVPVTLEDTLTIQQAGAGQGSTLAVSGLDPGCAEIENLAYRAIRLFETWTRRKVDVTAALVKRIPHGAGLGGGSADAAAALVGMSQLTGITLSPLDVSEMALHLGSDVPFFLGTGASFLAGRGETVSGATGLPGLSFAIVKPVGEVSTASAYSGLDTARGKGTPGRTLTRFGVRTQEAAAALRANDLDRAATLIEGANDLQPVAEGAHPEWAALPAALRAAGCRAAAMTGSGSAYFGLCDDLETATRVAAGFRRDGWFAAACASADTPLLWERTG